MQEFFLDLERLSQCQREILERIVYLQQKLKVSGNSSFELRLGSVILELDLERARSLLRRALWVEEQNSQDQYLLIQILSYLIDVRQKQRRFHDLEWFREYVERIFRLNPDNGLVLPFVQNCLLKIGKGYFGTRRFPQS